MPDAGHRRQRAIQLFEQRRTTREVTQSYAAARAENAREFASGIRFIGKRAVGTFANDCVERFVRERQAFGVTVLKSDQGREPFGRGQVVCVGDILTAVIDPCNVAAETFCQEKSSRTFAARRIEDMALRCEMEERANALGELQSSSM